MDVYVTLKFLHVVSAILWVGGGFFAMLLGTLASRARDGDTVLFLMRQIGFVGPRIFLPASVATLVFGLGTVWAGGLAFEAWLALGLAGTLFTAVFGHLFLRPLGERVARSAAQPDGRGAALAAADELLRLARIDYAVLFSVVALMVLKPGWSDVAVLGGLAALIALAAASVFAAPGRARAA